MYSISEGNRPHLALAKAFLGCIHLTVVADVLWHIAEVILAILINIITAIQLFHCSLQVVCMLLPVKLLLFGNTCAFPWVASVCILTRRWQFLMSCLPHPPAGLCCHQTETTEINHSKERGANCSREIVPNTVKQTVHKCFRHRETSALPSFQS